MILGKACAPKQEAVQFWKGAGTLKGGNIVVSPNGPNEGNRVLYNYFILFCIIKLLKKCTFLFLYLFKKLKTSSVALLKLIFYGPDLQRKSSLDDPRKP